MGLLGAYTIPDSWMSAKWKGHFIGCAGPIFVTLAGLGKEAKDRLDPAHHTSDINDAYATAIGGGAPLACIINFTF